MSNPALLETLDRFDAMDERAAKDRLFVAVPMVLASARRATAVERAGRSPT